MFEKYYYGSVILFLALRDPYAPYGIFILTAVTCIDIRSHVYIHT